MKKMILFLILGSFVLSCSTEEEKPPLSPDQRKSFGMYETYNYNEILGDLRSVDDLEENASLFGHLRPGMDAIIGFAPKKDIALIDSILTTDMAIKVLPHDIKFAWSSTLQETGNGPKMYALYALKKGKKDPRIVNKHIKTAHADIDINTGQNTILLTMTQQGSDLWAEMTTDNVMRNLAMVADRSVYFCPRVNEPIYGGQTQIAGDFTRKEAELVAAQILP